MLFLFLAAAASDLENADAGSETDEEIPAVKEIADSEIGGGQNNGGGSGGNSGGNGGSNGNGGGINNDTLYNNLTTMMNEIYNNSAYNEFTKHFPDLTIQHFTDILRIRYNVTTSSQKGEWMAQNNITNETVRLFADKVLGAFEAMRFTQTYLFFAVDYYNWGPGFYNDSLRNLNSARAEYTRFLGIAGEINTMLDGWNPWTAPTNNNLNSPSNSGSNGGESSSANKIKNLSNTGTTFAEGVVANDETIDSAGINPVAVNLPEDKGFWGFVKNIFGKIFGFFGL